MAPCRSAWMRSPLLHRHAVHRHGDAEVHDVDIGVRRQDRAGEHLEARRDHRDVADRAVGDDAEAAERLVHVRLHLAPERAVADVLAVEVLHDHDAGPWRARDVVEIVEPLLHVAGLAERHRVLRLEGHRLGEADDGRKLGEWTMQMLDRVAEPRRSGTTISTRLHTVGVSIDSQKFEIVGGRRRHSVSLLSRRAANIRRSRRHRRAPQSGPWRASAVGDSNQKLHRSDYCLLSPWRGRASAPACRRHRRAPSPARRGRSSPGRGRPRRRHRRHRRCGAPTRATRVARSASRKSPWKGTPRALGRALHHRPLLRFCKHAVDDGAVPGCGRAAGLVGDAGIDARRDLRRIGVRGKLFLFVLAEQRLALDVRAQHHGARRGPEVGRQRARQRRFAGAGKPADGDQARRWRFDQLRHATSKYLRATCCDRVASSRSSRTRSRAAVTLARIAARMDK